MSIEHCQLIVHIRLMWMWNMYTQFVNESQTFGARKSSRETKSETIQIYQMEVDFFLSYFSQCSMCSRRVHVLQRSLISIHLQTIVWQHEIYAKKKLIAACEMANTNLQQKSFRNFSAEMHENVIHPLAVRKWFNDCILAKGPTGVDGKIYALNGKNSYSVANRLHYPDNSSSNV